jgi:chromosome partitioning protein
MSASLAAKEAGPAKAKAAKIIMIFAPKGGVGKTTVAMNVAVAAATSGYRVLGLDFDTQRNFALWAVDRHDLPNAADLKVVEVRGAHMKDWREEVRLARSYDLIVVDTPPRADGEITLFLQEIGNVADLILMPTEVYGASTRFVVQFMGWWRTKSDRAVFVLNKTIAGRTLLREARDTLTENGGQVWQDSIPLRDDIARQLSLGYGALDERSFAGNDIFSALWRFCAEKIGVKAY